MFILAWFLHYFAIYYGLCKKIIGRLKISNFRAKHMEFLSVEHFTILAECKCRVCSSSMLVMHRLLYIFITQKTVYESNGEIHNRMLKDIVFHPRPAFGWLRLLNEIESIHIEFNERIITLLIFFQKNISDKSYLVFTEHDMLLYHSYGIFMFLFFHNSKYPKYQTCP